MRDWSTYRSSRIRKGWHRLKEIYRESISHQRCRLDKLWNQNSSLKLWKRSNLMWAQSNNLFNQQARIRAVHSVTKFHPVIINRLVTCRSQDYKTACKTSRRKMTWDLLMHFNKELISLSDYKEKSKLKDSPVETNRRSLSKVVWWGCGPTNNNLMSRGPYLEIKIV